MTNKNYQETFPIYHTGYMTGKDVFSLLLSCGFIDALESYIEENNICILTESILKTFYRNLMINYAVSINDEAVQRAKAMQEDKKEGYGIYRMLVEYTDWNILVGSEAYDLFTTISSGKEMYRCTASELGSGRVVLMDFIECESVAELSRIVKYSVYRLARLDITGNHPRIEHKYIKAVRPPYDEWGMVLYKERHESEK